MEWYFHVDNYCFLTEQSYFLVTVAKLIFSQVLVVQSLIWNEQFKVNQKTGSTSLNVVAVFLLLTLSNIYLERGNFQQLYLFGIIFILLKSAKTVWIKPIDKMNNHTKTTSTGIALVPLLIFETCISPEVKLRSGKIFVAF